MYQELEFQPSRQALNRYAAKNKPGLPRMSLRAVILLNDRAPAFPKLRIEHLGTRPHVRGGIGGVGRSVFIKQRGDRSYISLPSDGERGNGGVLFLPKAPQNTVHVLAWNVGRLPEVGRTLCNNRTHGERQFLNWLEAHLAYDPAFASRISGIYLYQSHSPCSRCADDFIRFVRQYPVLRNKIRIRWKTLYKDRGGCGHDTTSEGLGRMEQSGVASAIQKEFVLTDAQKKTLRSKARDIYKERIKKGNAKRRACIQVHHRIPLEWVHLIKKNPNSNNLQALTVPQHTKASNEWTKFREKYRYLGRTPSPSTIWAKAKDIDRMLLEKYRADTTVFETLAELDHFIEQEYAHH